MPHRLAPDESDAPRPSMQIALQTGTAAARDMMFYSASLIILGLFGAAFERHTGRALPVMVLLLGSFWSVGALLVGGFALRFRASDIELGAKALVVHGGEADGAEIDYTEIDPATIAIVEHGKESKQGTFPEAGLEFSLRKGPTGRPGRTLRLAKITDLWDERYLLEEIRDLIVALANQSVDVPKEPKPSIELLSCDACGSPAIPKAAMTVTCPSCRESIYVPEALRERFAEHQRLLATEDRMQTQIRSLLDQPSRGEVNHLLYGLYALLLIVPYVLLWGIGIDRYSLAVASFCLFHVYYQILRLRTLRRVGFRSLLFCGAGTRRLGDGEVPICRACGAPLPNATGKETAQRCAYCATTNLIALPFPWHFDRVSHARFNVEALLSKMTQTRHRCYRRLTYLGVVLALCAPGIVEWLS